MYLIKKINNFKNTIIEQRIVLYTLIIRDFKSRYLSSFIGLPWAFIQPAVYVFVIWFAFTYGLRSGNTTSGIPFAPWLLVSLIPWMFMSQTMIVNCMALTEYSYLIKKTKFKVSFIPVIKILSGMIVHLIMALIIMLILIFSFKIYPTIYWIQFFYYLIATFMLLSGISWFVASVNVYIKDMAHIVNILVSMLFWATPIVWPYSMLQGNYRYIALLNPFFYITEGYRYTFVEKKWFFDFPEMNFYFWTLTLIIFAIGFYTFNRLKRNFGDVL